MVDRIVVLELLDKTKWIYDSVLKALREFTQNSGFPRAVVERHLFFLDIDIKGKTSTGRIVDPDFICSSIYVIYV